MAARILVVDHDAKLQRLLADTLREEGFEVLEARSGGEALKQWASQRPSLILLDAGLPRMDGYQVTSKIRADEGRGIHVPIIMLGAETDIEHKVRGLRSGADDFLSKPFHSGELLARIRSLLVRFAPGELRVGRAGTGRVLAFYGAKGGVGTTTLAINTAIALHRGLKRTVALVDANLQFGDHRVFLDLGRDRKGIVDVVSDPAMDPDVLRQVLLRHESGVALLLAPPAPETADLVRPEAMNRILRDLQPIFDFIVVDCDRRLDEITLQIFDLADTIFLVMTADLSSLKNVALVLEMARNLDYERDKVQLVLNRAAAGSGISVREAEAVLKQRIHYEFANDYRGAITALNQGTPFAMEKGDSVLGRAVRDFALSIDRGAPATQEGAAAVAASAGAQAAVKPG